MWQFSLGFGYMVFCAIYVMWYHSSGKENIILGNAFKIDPLAVVLLNERMNKFEKFIGANESAVKEGADGMLYIIFEIKNRYTVLPQEDKLKEVGLVSRQYAAKVMTDVLLGYTDRFGQVVFKYHYKGKGCYEVKVPLRELGEIKQGAAIADL